MNRIWKFLHLQPKPISTSVASLVDGAGGHVTAIARLWKPGDAEKCRLCEECTATRLGMCLMLVPRHVPDEEVKLYALRDESRRETE